MVAMFAQAEAKQMGGIQDGIARFQTYISAIWLLCRIRHFKFKFKFKAHVQDNIVQ